MFNPLSLVPLLLLLSSASAIPTGTLEERAATKCGSNSYTAAQVSAAASKAYSYYQSGDTAGSSTYPHKYNNYEGFSFSVSGPYQEFPLLASHSVYSGGSPGPDRVIINTSGKLAGEITHTGASGNNFVGCSGTS